MKTVKRTRKKYLEVLVFIGILLITSFLLPQNSIENSWIVLSEKIHPYKSDGLIEKESSITLAYPQEIHGELLGDHQFGVVKLLIADEIYYLPIRLLLDKTSLESNQKNIPVGQEKVDINIPLPRNYKPDDLVKLNQKWNYHAADYSKYLRKETALALVKMFDEAKKQGLTLKVVSAFRAFSKQRQLYLKAINKNGINQNTVAKPGHSEHQLGTTIDVSSYTPESVLNESFADTKEGKWMKKNAPRFGFYQSYTIANSEFTGYIPEPWHFRYFGQTKK